MHDKYPSTLNRRQQLHAVFTKHDRDNSGDVDVSELRSIFHELGVHKSDQDIIHIIQQAHNKDSSTLNFEEFVNVFSVSNLIDVFNEIDSDRSGAIKKDEIKAAMHKLGYSFTPKQCDLMMSQVDLDHNNEISFEEFKSFFENVPLASLESIAKHWAEVAFVTDIGTDFSPTIPQSGCGLKWWQTVLAGGTAGVISRTATAPLEKIKLSAQTGINSGLGLLGELRSIYATQGMRGLFAGNFVNCLRVFPTAGITCTCYLNLLAMTPADAEFDAMEPVYRVLCAGTAALVANTITYPLDMLRARATVVWTSYSPPSVLNDARQILSRKGLKGFYHGLKPTLMAVVPFVAIQNTSIDLMRDAAIQNGVQPSTGLLLTVGAAAGLMAQCVVFPLDVIRRRFQVYGSNGNKHSMPSTQANVNILSDRTWLSMKNLVGQHGYRALFAGIVPTFVKTIPAVAIVAAVKGKMNSYFKEQNMQNH